MRLLSIGLLVAAIAATPAKAATTILKIATLSPDGTTWMKAMREGAEEIDKRTNGRVRFRFYPGGIMGNNSSVLRKIRVRQLHGGAITGGSLAEILPDANIYSLPMAFRSNKEADYVRVQMDGLILDRLKEKGFISFGLSEGGFAFLMADKPLHDVNDLKAQKVWVPAGDPLGRAAFEAVGVAPVSLPLTDVLTGLQTGLINTVATSPIGAIALQWHTKVKYLTDVPLLYLYGALVIQRRVFERLGAEDQETVQRVMSDVFRRINQKSRQDNTEALEALRGQGIVFVQPTDEQAQRWRRRMDDVVDRLAGSGAVNPKLLETLRKHLHEYRRNTAP